ncbi:MAG: hypothetical protein OEM53_06590 [Nitrosopumilus sp.]|nr:hypothetical protein [Nitrosopumilus sp.]MDH5555063.1 hypothetical protein [Nitrosopumilus sp.]
MELYKSKYSDKKKSHRNNKRNNESFRSFRYSRDDNRGESTTVTCADCSAECQVPFVPRTDRPVYCSDCFRRNKSHDSESDRSSRYSRDDRSSRYSRDDRSSRYSRDDRSSRSSYGQESSANKSRSKKSRNDKFLKKQERFYSHGSDKFYAGIKEKLFEILGGKICSSCGFKDERALEIGYIFGDDSSDGTGRGNASLMGKYISEPELARKELKVLCLNCNELREIISKPEENYSKPKQKKSRYFPR